MFAFHCQHPQVMLGYLLQPHFEAISSAQARTEESLEIDARLVGAFLDNLSQFLRIPETREPQSLIT